MTKKQLDRLYNLVRLELERLQGWDFNDPEVLNISINGLQVFFSPETDRLSGIVFWFRQDHQKIVSGYAEANKSAYILRGRFMDTFLLEDLREHLQRISTHKRNEFIDEMNLCHPREPA